jgi:hypothetical protein
MNLFSFKRYYNISNQMIPTISHIEYHQTIKEDFYYEATWTLTDDEKAVAADLSGCAVHELRETAPIIRYAYRYNPKLLRKTYDRDFVAIMNHEYPDWNPNEWEVGFTPVRALKVEKGEEKRCICGHWIHDCCIWRHEKTKTYILVGNVCIKKISENAYRDMLSCVKKQKEREEENKRKKEREEQLRKYERWREEESKKNKERDDLVARVEKEYDDHMETVAKFNDLKQRTRELEKQTMMVDLFRPCEVCHNLAVLKDSPVRFTKCILCFRK